MKTRTTSLNKRLHMLLLICFVPLTGMLIYLFVMVHQFSVRYDKILKNMASANNYNLSFKEEMDYNMYIIIVNSDRASKLVDLEQPHAMIADIRETFSELFLETDQDSEAKREIKMILQNLDKLERRVTEIERDAKIVGMYDTNMNRLDMDIRILTELIQEGIQVYIMEEIQHLESLREGLRQDSLRAIMFGVILFGSILVIAILVSRQIKQSITDGITQLQRVTRKAGKGEFDVRADLEGCDEELAELGTGFNQMVERLGTLVEDIKEEQLNIRKIEQKLLQAQINPHFLYNTLDAIIWLAEAGEDKKVIVMVTALSDFFRTTLSKGKDFITVEEETSHIESYLKIQQFRYQDILEYKIDIPQELYPYQIRKLMLQPLVENALYHGIKNKRGKGHIQVRGWKEKGNIYFTVSDNGIGMTEERLCAVRREIYQSHESRKEPTSFGLFNVAQRIRLNYGDDYGLDIESEYKKGTTVRICIPANLTEHDK